MKEPSKLFKVGSLVYTKPQLAILFFWLLWGDFCYVMMEAVTPSIMPLKMKGLGASNTVIAIVLSTIPWTIGMVLNPIISFRSDRFRSRWGRRIPFLVFSLPFLVLCLIGLGFGDRIGFALQAAAGPLMEGVSPEMAAIGVLAVFLVAFTFFNTFMNSVFWYLFNDVVPEHMLARFMSWFRLVGLGTSSLYYLCIFPFAESHTSEIFLGAALLYLIGFGLMCWNVKEGEYPPPPAYQGGQTGVVAAVKTYAKECHTLPHYWFQFLGTASGAIAGAGGTFMIFFFQAIGLGLADIGKVSSCAAVVTAIFVTGSGWLADRFHPLRVVLVGTVLNTFLGIPILLIWLFWHPSSEVAFWVLIAKAILVTGPIAALLGVWDPPLLMRLFPRSRYGQFCSANSIWRAVGAIIGSVTVGVFLDSMRGFVGETRAYLFLPVWMFLFNVPVVLLTWKLFQSWKRYGGDKSYVPPIPNLSPDVVP